MPMTIAGTPASTSSTRLTTVASDARRELVDVERDEDSDRERHQRRDADDDERARERVCETLPRVVRPNGGVFVIRSRFSSLAPLPATDQTRGRGSAIGDRSGEPGERLHEPVDARRRGSRSTCIPAR